MIQLVFDFFGGHPCGQCVPLGLRKAVRFHTKGRSHGLRADRLAVLKHNEEHPLGQWSGGVLALRLEPCDPSQDIFQGGQVLADVADGLEGSKEYPNSIVVMDDGRAAPTPFDVGRFGCRCHVWREIEEAPAPGKMSGLSWIGARGAAQVEHFAGPHGSAIYSSERFATVLVVGVAPARERCGQASLACHL